MTVTFVNTDSDQQQQKQESSSSHSSTSNNNQQQDDQVKKDDTNNEPSNESETNKERASSSPTINFPVDDLQRLDEMLNRTRWIVPVLPKNELETLLDASIALCREKLDTKSEHCQRFFRDGLQLSFVRILTDDAVNTWKNDIYKHIYNNTLKGVELCTLKMLDDWFPLLELLALIFNPQCKYHVINSMRSPEMIVKVNVSNSITDQPHPPASQIQENKIKLNKVKKSNDLVSSDENIDDEEENEHDEIELEERINYDEMIDEQDDDLIDELNDEEEEYDDNDNDEEDEDENSDDNLSVYSGQSDSNEKMIEEGPKDSVMADFSDIVDDVIVKSSLDDDNNNNNNNDTSKVKSVKKKSKNQKNTKQSTKQTTNKQKSTKNKKSLNSNLSNITTNSSLLNTKNELSLSKLSDSNSNKGDTSLNNNNNSNDQVPEIQENVPTQILYTTYARSYLKAPYGWLIDFINYFGQLDGFKLLLERFTNNVKLNIQVIAALLK